MQDLYQSVTDKIIAALESGVAPWVRPWNSSALHGGMPYNALSGKPYRGINIPLLACSPYASNGWLTFKQAKDLGANVRKGDHGSLIVFFKPFQVVNKNATSDEKVMKTIPVLKCFHVFNLEQIDNLPERLTVKREPIPPMPAADLLCQATIVHGGDRACYSPAHDVIRMPQPGQFRSLTEYQATALHELTHWTGHTSRMAREYGKKFGDQAYAREELVAEMGAAFLCARCGLDGQLQHPEYIANWLKVLKEDKRAILTAASHAQKAVDFILREQVEVEESETVAA